MKRKERKSILDACPIEGKILRGIQCKFAGLLVFDVSGDATLIARETRV
jgi:hypothetical protein